MSPTTLGHRSDYPLVRAYYEFIKGNTTGGRCKRVVDSGVGARRGKLASIGTSFYRGMDLDLNGKNVENGGPTFSAINARSYHPGGVNPLLGDGSVRLVKSSIDGMVSGRELGTVAGGEVVRLEGD